MRCRGKIAADEARDILGRRVHIDGRAYHR